MPISRHMMAAAAKIMYVWYFIRVFSPELSAELDPTPAIPAIARQSVPEIAQSSSQCQWLVVLVG